MKALLLATLAALAIIALARRSADLSDHHVHILPGTSCAVCEWDEIERRLG